MAKKKLSSQQIRQLLIVIAIIGVSALTAFNIWSVKSVKQEMVQQQMSGGKSYGEADIGGDFTMTNQDGKSMAFSDTKGKLRLVFFGFTHCPDICPVSLLTITNALNTLGEEAAKVQPVFVTVDPKRDTPEVMKTYIANFHPSIIGLTGSKEELEKATKAFKAFYSVHAPVDAKGADEHGDHAAHGGMDHSQHGMDYNVDHSGFIYVMDAEGKYLAHLPYNVEEQVLVDTIKPYLE